MVDIMYVHKWLTLCMYLHFHLPSRAPVPSRKSISVWANYLKTMGHETTRRGGNIRTVRMLKNVDAVWAATTRSPQRSARHHSFALGLLTRTVRRILHDDLNLHPNKMQVVHVLSPGDYPICIGFCKHMLQLFEDDLQLTDNLWMTNETHFHFSRFFNKHNFRCCTTANPQQHKWPLHSAKVTAWCAISSNEITGPYFFEDDDVHAVTITSACYVQMLETFLILEL